MKFFKVFLSSFFVISALLIANCGREESNFVARIGGRIITLQEFENDFAKGKKTEDIKKSSLQEKKEHLDKMINRELKIIDAYQHKLEEKKEIIDIVNRYERYIVGRRLIDLEVTQKVMPESEIKAFYKNANKQIKIRQILIKFDPNSPEQKSTALDRAKKMAERLKEGENFAKLASEVSDDISTAKNGGDKGYLKWGPTSHENPVYRAAFSMRKDEISDPIETKNGYYIIKIVHIKSYPAPPYELARDRIRNQIYSIRSNEFSNAYFEYLDNLKNKYKLNFKEKSLEIFIEQLLLPKDNYADSSQQDSKTIKKDTSSLDNFSDNDQKLVVANFQDGEITIEDIINELKSFSPHRRPRITNKSEAQDFINTRIVPRYLLEREAEVKNIKKDNTVIKQVVSFKENEMIKHIYKLQVTDKIEISDNDLRSYFEQHRVDYKHPEMREVQHIYVIDGKLAENIVRRARKGENFVRLFRLYNKKEEINQNNGILEISEGRAGIGKPAFSVNKGEITDPIPIGEGFYIVKVLNIKEQILKTFEEVRPIVSNKVRRLATEKREKEWLDELRNRINFIIFENNLKKSFRNYVGKDILTIE